MGRHWRQLSLSFAAALLCATNSFAAEADALLRSLDDPANPHRAEYCELDRWLVEHYDPAIDQAEADAWFAEHGRPDFTRPEMLSGELLLSIFIDLSGFVVPSFPEQSLSARRPLQVEHLRDLPAAMNPGASSARRSVGYVRVSSSDPQFDDYRRKLLQQLARQDPLIPAWLGRRPPLQVMFPPNGEIVVQGELGLLDYSASSDPGRSGMGYRFPVHRYDKEGRLLGSSLQREPEELYYGQYWEGPSLSERYPDSGAQGLVFLMLGDLVMIVHAPLLPDGTFTDIAKGSVLAAYDYRGQELDLDAPYELRRSPASYGLSGSMVSRAYRSQCAAGLTDPALDSPFLGSAEGPVVHDGLPLDRLILASRGHDAHKEYIAVRSLDDPANPYAGLYSELDRFIHGNEQRLGTASSETANWKTFNTYVDAGGWQVPLSMQNTLPQQLPFSWVAGERPAGWQQRRYYMFSSAEVTAEQQEEYSRTNMTSWALDYAPIPPWLAANPPLMAISGPDGEWVTCGPAGGYDPALDGSAQIKSWESAAIRNYCVYSATGELLKSVDADLRSWNELYAPAEVAAIYATADTDTALRVAPWGDRLFLLRELPSTEAAQGIQRTESELVAHYDWRGIALPLLGPYEPESRVGMQIPGSRIAEYYDAQQRQYAQGSQPGE